MWICQLKGSTSWVVYLNHLSVLTGETFVSDILVGTISLTHTLANAAVPGSIIFLFSIIPLAAAYVTSFGI